ncbi:ribosome small subunit-dependent GTPase A [Merdimmobilis hominis]|jgi:ribosome biogenesis GTPase|uniref:Small ribosomal subunit biogenesis GTPase RsgA n=1 Tax=uncultured Anaerotruncus sp. TaxID=905011 RepID=A0A6N2VAL2_9FIRM|nr:ribosome small subunit-dependent GTPase A [Merdimmobilis hominis]MCD4837098.1 ribosome small subunit-dependent GTPase A [Merdimmobilis hominis]PWL58340.1 MAG: ribosome small subunit-dependent GTPase A [Oscillospiraceae bacterium]
MAKEGLIVRALSGFYYVKTGEGQEVECRARGLFRKQEISPCVGDRVELEETGEGKGQVVAILPRKNSLVRPPVANLDLLVLVVSSCEPLPNLLVLDKLLAIAECQNIPPAIVLTKSDLEDPSPVADIYRKVGYPVFVVSSETGEGVEEVRAFLSGKLCAFTGNTGVGKSSLLNRIDPRLSIETAQISQKLGRGRHTTRHVQLYEQPGGGYIADTPGFSAVDLERFQVILKEDLELCFPEFEPYRTKCRFTGCSHTKEKGCAVLAAVEAGEIPKSRHESYLSLYEDAKNIKEWELK